jgi:hypothetical protein
MFGYENETLQFLDAWLGWIIFGIIVAIGAWRNHD